MKMKKLVYMLITALIAGGFAFSTSVVHAQKDTVTFRNALKIDLVPVYYDFFDTRKQIRLGIEYERQLNEKSFAAIGADFGMFDHYTYIKYYDFYNQGPGLYSVETIVKNLGFHLLPSYNYFLWKSRNNNNTGLFAGCIIDFHLYQKILNSTNELNATGYTEKYFQTRMGAGLSLGGRFGMGRHFFADFRSSLLGKLFRTTSINNVPQIKPLNAHWTNRKYTLWWVTSLNISYAF